MSKRITIKDVAAQAGTSAATVSYVLNNVQDRYITPKVRKNVIAAAEDLGYVKSLAASRLKGKKMGVIAFLTPQLTNHFFLEIFFAIEKIANKKGYVLSVCNTYDDPELEKSVIDRLNQLWIDACLIIPTHKGKENATYLRNHGIPFVSIERPLEGFSDYDLISSDNFGAAYQMTSHMISMGHKRIALVYWNSLILNLDERLLGYQKALLDHGIAFDEKLVFQTKSVDLKAGESHDEGWHLTEKIVQDSSITAIFYSQYVLAEGGVRYLHSIKYAIPEDISVGVLGGPKWVTMAEKPFTFVSQPGTAMGNLAAETIFNRIDKQGDSFLNKKLPCKLNLGESIKDISK